MKNERLILQLQLDATLLSQTHSSNNMMFSLHLVLFFSCFLLSSATKTNFAGCHKVTGSLKGGCPFHPNTTLSPSQQISAAATITHFDVLFNSNCSPHSRILACSTFAPFCFLDFSVQPCRQLCLVVKSSCIHLFILYNIQWPAALNCSSFPSPPQICFTAAFITVFSKYHSKFKVHQSDLYAFIFFFISIANVIFRSKHFHHHNSISTSIIAQNFSWLVCCFWKLSFSFILYFSLLFMFPLFSPQNTASTHRCICRFHRRRTTRASTTFISTTTRSSIDHGITSIITTTTSSS